MRETSSFMLQSTVSCLMQVPWPLERCCTLMQVLWPLEQCCALMQVPWPLEQCCNSFCSSWDTQKVHIHYFFVCVCVWWRETWLVPVIKIKLSFLLHVFHPHPSWQIYSMTELWSHDRSIVWLNCDPMTDLQYDWKRLSWCEYPLTLWMQATCFPEPQGPSGT